MQFVLSCDAIMNMAMKVGRQLGRIAVAASLAAALGGCALYSDVSISPLIVHPTNVGAGLHDLQQILRKSDYLRAIELTSLVETRQRRSAAELGALGEAELCAGRYDDARRHLRAAIDLEPFRTTYAQIAWNLSQVEYMSNNYDIALDWARLAQQHGLNIKQWHLDFLESMSNVRVYKFPGQTVSRIPMHVGRPDVPRIDVRVNGKRDVAGVVDSGAVLSIISERFASTLPLHSLGNFKGTFYGLLGEPIDVRFALLESVELGDMVIENVPVAIMPDDMMSFLVNDKREFNIDFLLGANLLKEFKLDLDFKRNVITFSKLTAADRQPDFSQNLFIENFRPVVRGAINRRGWYLFVLDTGSEVTFLNEMQMFGLPVQTFQLRKVHNATLQGLGGAKKRGDKIENVEIGVDKWAGTFRDMPMYTSGEGERAVGILGENYLKNFHVIIDFGKMRVDLAV